MGHSPPLPLPSVIQLVIVLTRLPVPHYGLAIISVLGLMSAVKRWDIPPAVAWGTLLAHVYQMRDTDLVVLPTAAVSCCAPLQGTAELPGLGHLWGAGNLGQWGSS